MSESFKEVALRTLSRMAKDMFMLTEDEVEPGAAQPVFNATVAAVELGATSEEVRDALAIGLAQAKLEAL